MASYLDVPDFDLEFKKVSNPIIVNDIPYITAEEKENFSKIILTTYESDVLSSIPSCFKGCLTGAHYLNSFCPNCGTEVKLPTDGDIDNNVWIRIPDGFIGFIHIRVWVQITQILNPKGYNILEWMTNSSAIIPKNASKDTLKRINYLEARHWPRGINGFIENFDEFINILLTPLFKPKEIEFCTYLKSIKDRIFSKYIPMPVKAMLIYEKTQVGAYADNRFIDGAINAARNIASISVPRTRPLSHKQIESRLFNVISHLVNYYTINIKEGFTKKSGWFRGQVFRSRSHFAARGVITSINEPHCYEEVHIPWAQGLELFKVHLVSKLYAAGWSFIEAFSLIESNGNVYVPLLDNLLKEIIAEGEPIERISEPMEINMPKAGLECLIQRNPSLARGSALCQYITKVKTDLTDKTIGFGVLNTRHPNADIRMQLWYYTYILVF